VTGLCAPDFDPAISTGDDMVSTDVEGEPGLCFTFCPRVGDGEDRKLAFTA
jgi:hypothetical protein